MLGDMGACAYNSTVISNIYIDLLRGNTSLSDSGVVCKDIETLGLPRQTEDLVN